jgi:hypothetical protein
MYDPRLLIPKIPPEKLRIRLASPLLELMLRGEPPQVDFSFNFMPQAMHRLSELASAAEFVLMLAQELQTAPVEPLMLSIDVAGRQVGPFQLRAPVPISLTEEGRRAAQAISDAGHVTRVLNLDLEAEVSASELLAWADRLLECRILLETDRSPMEVRGEVNADAPEDDEYGFPFTTATVLGPNVVLLGAAIHGHPKFQPTGTVGRKSFHLVAPSVDIVTKQVLIRKRSGRHSLRAQYRQSVTWLADRKIHIIPMPMPSAL